MKFLTPVLNTVVILKSNKHQINKANFEINAGNI